jgi:hypothetical protein
VACDGLNQPILLAKHGVKLFTAMASAILTNIMALTANKMQPLTCNFPPSKNVVVCLKYLIFGKKLSDTLYIKENNSKRVKIGQ